MASAAAQTIVGQLRLPPIVTSHAILMQPSGTFAGARMPGHLTIVPTPFHGGCVIRVSGTIDESFNCDAMVDAGRGVVAIDLDQVARITSFGVREWVRALHAMSGNALYIGLVRCRPTIVAQFNMVSSFAGHGQLVSFYAPLSCPKCSTEYEQLIDLRRDHAQVKAFSLPRFLCPSCGVPAELDEPPAAYLAHAAGAPTPKPPPIFEQMLSGEPPRAAGLALRKEVRGNVTRIWLSGELDASPRFKRLADGLEGDVVVMCGDVQQVTPEGLEALIAFIDATPAAMHLARLPGVLAAGLRKRPGLAGRAKICSVLLKFRCTECGDTSEREVGPAWLVELTKGLQEGASCECGGRLTAAFSPDELRQARAMSMVEPSDEVLRSLAGNYGDDGDDRPGPPVGEMGEETFGRYQIVRNIGAGGMAQVSLARQTGIGGFEKKLVVKRILPQFSQDPAFVRMFLQEARLAARISHPNVVQIFDFGQVGNRYFIGMEYVRGWDLAAIRRVCQKLSTPFPVELAAFVVSRICAGLHAAHTCVDDEGKIEAIIHRDVSPHNVLVSSDGHVKLTDFGIAKAFGSGSLTPTATLKGKLSYMSPEQVRSDSTMDPRSDLFSAGIILYELLTHQNLFRRDNEYATLDAILHASVDRLGAGYPAAIADIVARSLARDPDQRYQTGHEFQRDLEAFLRQLGTPTGAPQLGSWVKDIMDRALGDELPPSHAFTPTGMRTPKSPASRQVVVSAVTVKVPAGSALLVHGSGKRLDECTPVVSQMVARIDQRDALGAPPADGAYSVILADYDGLTPEERTRLTLAFAGLKTSTRLVIVSEGECRKDFVQLFGSHALTNLIGRNTRVDPEDLIITLHKLLRRDIFGVERYFSPGANLQALRVATSADKTRVLAQAEAYAQSRSVHPRLAGQFLSVADELLTNAVFNAPVDAQGNSRYRSLSRVNEVVLKPGEEIEVTLCADSKRLGLSVADPFGSLTRERLLDYLAKCFRRDSDQVSRAPGGAGLGFYFLFESLSQFVVNISAGRRTEMLGLIDLRGSYRDFARSSKSFNVFYQG